MNTRKALYWTWALPVFLIAIQPLFGQDAANDYPIRPVSFTKIRITDEFWSHRLRTNRIGTIPHTLRQLESRGRVDNFEIAGGLKEGDHRGAYPFDDTDVYKVIEGAAYSLQVQDDPDLRRRLTDLIKKIAAAQEEDGYIYTARTNNSRRLRNWTGPERWSNLNRSHELYNAGHLLQAAVAHYEATGQRDLLDVAIRFADLIEQTFGPGKMLVPPGHQIIEMGLVRLYRATGKEKYLRLAKFFLDQRGRGGDERRLGGTYGQDHVPVTEQDEAVGHAVRAVYMYAGMADIAALTADSKYTTAIDRLWNNVVSKKLYITGGIGASGSGESFGGNYNLPNLSAYVETCSSIGNVFWNHRMFLLHGDARYIDVLERTLYNAALAGVSLEGTTFFYPNPLESHGTHKRSPWFSCACCPGNVARFIPRVPEYIYGTTDDAIYVNLYVAGESEVELGGQTVKIVQQTRYPWDGAVKISIEPDRAQRFTLLIRIPGWARNEPVPSDLYTYLDSVDRAPGLRVNGETVAMSLEKGYVPITRNWRPGDSIELDLPMPIRRVVANENVEADRGKVALQRGPIVYCAEWPDNKDGQVLNLVVPDDAPLRHEFRSDLLYGIEVIRGDAIGLAYAEDGETLLRNKQELTAIPYYAWAHRGEGDMSVWLARNEKAARPRRAPTIASMSRVESSRGTGIKSINDQIKPRSSGDHRVSFFHWWPRKATLEWVEYHFPEPQEISSVALYWFDDTGRGECRIPKSWRLLYREGEEWKPVYTTDTYGVAKDQFNRISFEAVRTGAVRLEVQLPDGFSAGIHEFIVK